MKFISSLHLVVMLLVLTLACPSAFAQYDPNQTDETGLSARFKAMRNEAGFVCGNLLPSAIEGITELMPLCGARLGFKVGPRTFMEPQFLAGAARGQRYIIGSLSFRGDFQYDDLIWSYYGGGDMHYPTKPDYNTTPPGESTSFYFGLHVGGAIMAELAESLYFRTDLKANINPGSSLYIGFSLVLRFNPGGGAEGAGDNPPPQ
jgi:hypothetical protein